MIQHRWFRIEQGNDGSILSCTEVEAKGVKGGTVRFYSAVDASAACALAKDWYANHMRNSASRQSTYRAKRINEGLCSRDGCKNEPLPDKTMCRECLDYQNARLKELRERRGNGIPPRPPGCHTPGGPAAIMQRKLANDRATHQRNKGKYGPGDAYKYYRILQKLDTLSPGEAKAFRAWLVSKIPSMNQNWHPPMAAQEETSQAAE